MQEAAEELLTNKAAIQAVAGQGGVTTPGALLLMHGRSYVERLKAAGIGITVTTERSRKEGLRNSLYLLRIIDVAALRIN